MRDINEGIPINADDKTFFDAFYEKYKKFMFHTAKKYVDNQQDLEDMVHDSVVRLMKNIPTLRQLLHAESVKYIMLTVKSVYLDNEKICKKDDLIFMNDEEMEAIMAKQLQNTRSDQDIIARLAVQKLKRILPARDWLLLEAKYNLGLSHQEVGALLNVKPDSVRMLLHRAREKAKQILGEETAQGGGRNGK